MYWEIGIKAISALFQGFLLICLDVGLCLIFIVLLLSMASAYCNFLLFFPLLYLCVSLSSVKFSSVQSLSCVRLFATPWIATSQASLSITNSQSSPKLMSIQSMMPSSHLILYCPLLLLTSLGDFFGYKAYLYKIYMDNIEQLFFIISINCFQGKLPPF